MQACSLQGLVPQMNDVDPNASGWIWPFFRCINIQNAYGSPENAIFRLLEKLKTMHVDFLIEKIQKRHSFFYFLNINFSNNLLVCLFEVFRPTREFFTHMETSPLPVKGCKFWPMLGTHGHWAGGFFSVPHLMWHGSSVYNGHFWGLVTLTPIAERLAVELLLYVWLWLRSVAAGIGTPNLPHARRTL